MKFKHLRSSVAGKLPQSADIDVGQIAINFNDGDPFLSIKDSAGAVRRLGGSSVGGTAPGTPTDGALWVDTSVSPPVLKIYDLTNTAWIDASPDATTSIKGIVQLADAAAIAAGTVGRVVDAAQLKANTPPDASETIKGIAEIATTAEVTTGTDDTRIVTPAKLKAYVATNAPTPPDATESAKGIVELATAAETTAGTDATRAVHPAGLKVELDKLKLWDRTGTTISPATAGDTIQGQLVPTNGSLGSRNVLVNGEFLIWQRGTADYSAAGLTIFYGSADRWAHVGGATSTGGMVSSGLPAGFVAGINLANACLIGQRIEFSSRFTASSTWTLSVWATGVPTFYLVDDAGTQHIPGGSAGIPTGETSGTFTRYSFTCTFAATSSNGWLQFTVGNSSGGTITFTGAQMEEGPVATPFEHKPAALTLSICRRYFALYNGFVPTTPVLFVYNTRMRATPTLSLQNATSSAGLTTSGVLTQDMCYLGKTTPELCGVVLDAEIK